MLNGSKQEQESNKKAPLDEESFQSADGET